MPCLHAEVIGAPFWEAVLARFLAQRLREALRLIPGEGRNLARKPPYGGCLLGHGVLPQTHRRHRQATCRPKAISDGGAIAEKCNSSVPGARAYLQGNVRSKDILYYGRFVMAGIAHLATSALSFSPPVPCEGTTNSRDHPGELGQHAQDKGDSRQLLQSADPLPRPPTAGLLSQCR